MAITTGVKRVISLEITGDYTTDSLKALVGRIEQLEGDIERGNITDDISSALIKVTGATPNDIYEIGLDLNFSEGSYSVNFGGIREVIQSYFSGIDRLSAEISRDSYFAGNPDQLSLYSTDIPLSQTITLEFFGGTAVEQKYNPTSEAWEDQSGEGGVL